MKLSATAFLGLILNTAFGWWWWADAVVALLVVAWTLVIKEGLKAFDSNDDE